MNTVYLVAAGNLFLSIAVVWGCICRLNASSASTVRRGVRIKYVALLVGALANGFSRPLFGEWPGYAQTFFAACVLMTLLVEMHRWRHGAPNDVRTDLGQLGAPELEPPTYERRSRR